MLHICVYEAELCNAYKVTGFQERYTCGSGWNSTCVLIRQHTFTLASDPLV